MLYNILVILGFCKPKGGGMMLFIAGFIAAGVAGFNLWAGMRDLGTGDFSGAGFYFGFALFTALIAISAFIKA